MYISLQDLIAQPEKQFLIQTFFTTGCFLGISRQSSNINQTIIQVGASNTATKWRLLKSTTGKYGFFCSKVGGSLQVAPGVTQHQTPSFAGKNYAQDHQTWTLKAVSGSPKVYFIQSNITPKRVLDIYDYKYTQGNKIYAHTQNDGSDNNDRNQKWRLLWAY